MKHEKKGKDEQTNTDTNRRHPPGKNYSPRRNLFRRGQKMCHLFMAQTLKENFYQLIIENHIYEFKVQDSM